MRSVLTRLRSHPKITIPVAVLGLLWGVHRFLDWKTERDWQQYCVEARARGVKFTLEELVTPEIPDEENFAALPMWRTVFAAAPGRVRIFELPRPSAGASDLPLKKTAIDWKAWQQAFRNGGLIANTTDDPVADVLRGLDSFGSKITEWREWKTRPHARFPFDPKQGIERAFPPQHDEALAAATFFGLRMRAHLEQGDAAAALEDFSDALQSYRAIACDSLWQSGSLRMSVLQHILARIGTGLAKQAWKEPQLAAIEGNLRQLSIREDVRFAISSERTWVNSIYEEMLGDAGKRARLLRYGRYPPSSPNGWEQLISHSISRRKLRRNQLRTQREYDRTLAALETKDPAELLPKSSEDRAEPNIVERWQSLPYYVIPTPGTQDYSLHTAARLETALAQARIAIALERYLLVPDGSFPEMLETLVPTFLSEPLLDPWTARPMIYSRTGKSFRLYSTGRDRTDDGGTIDPTKYGFQQRDEIWLYAPP